MAGSFRLKWLILALLLSTALLSGCRAQTGTAAAATDDHAHEEEHALETAAAPGTEEHADEEDHAAHEAEEAAEAAAVATAAAEGDTHTDHADHAGEEGELAGEEEGAHEGHAHGMSYEAYCECRKGDAKGVQRPEERSTMRAAGGVYHSLAPPHIR